MSEPWRTACLLAVALCLPGPKAAHAETVIRVPTDAATLDLAISLVPDGGTVELAAGTYFAPTGGFQFGDLGKGFTIRGESGMLVALDGGGTEPILWFQNQSRAMGGPVVFENLTFQNGRSTTDGLAGGLTLVRAEVTFIDCIFDSNESFAPQSGGGGVTVASDSLAFFLRCVFRDNVAKNEAAGLRITTDSFAYIHECEFYDNLANPPGHRNTAAGGAIHIANASMWVTNSHFEGNQAGYSGGAILSIGSWQEPYDVPRTEVMIANSTFINNEAVSDPGVTTPSPPEAGAVHAENQTRLRIYNSRFLKNRAGKGGGVNLFRSDGEIHGSVFRGNQATALGPSTGFGGAIGATSNDGPADGTNNRPNARLVVRDTLIQGRYDGVTTVGQGAGGILISGDKNREYGTAGVTQMGPTSANRMEATIDNVAFVDCDVTETPEGGKGLGGGLSAEMAVVDITNSLFYGCDAFGTQSTGGAIRFVIDAVGTITHTAFVDNSAEQFGGAIFGQGSDLDIVDSQFFQNELSPGVVEHEWLSYGASIFFAPLAGFEGQDYPMTGTVSGSTFSDDIGLSVFDGDLATGPINDVRYNGNTFYNTTYGSTVYRDAVAGGPVDAAGLNAMVVTRDPGAGNTDKSQVANTQPGSSVVLGALLAVPPQLLAAVAAGDAEVSTESFLAYAWNGAGATLDGVPLGTTTGLQSSAAGIHTLAVAPESFLAEITNGTLPQATLTADPADISGGESSTLDWAVTAGTFLSAGIDQEIGIQLATSGSTVVNPPETTTYLLHAVTQEGGLAVQATVGVDEALIFTDGFESGDLLAWSSSQ